MSRYIDAEYDLHNLPFYYDFSDEELIAIHSAMRGIPTADVVEVVRCKDCVHYWKNGEDVAICLASPKDDAFCSDGER